MKDGTFKKTIHGETSDDEQTVDLYSAYTIECETQIKNAIAGNPSADYEYWASNPSYLGVPNFMVKTTDTATTYTFDPSDKIRQIELSEDFFKAQREAKIKEMIKDNAQEIAKQFNIDNCTITVTFND